jgi:hypothetical protein
VPERQREQRVAQMLVVAEPALRAADNVARHVLDREVEVLGDVSHDRSSAPFGSTCQS